jgi:hypothetical protein
MPSISIATALSGAVGPLSTRQRQRKADKRRHKNALLTKLDCHLSIEGNGRKSMTTAAIAIAAKPMNQRVILFIIRISS